MRADVQSRGHTTVIDLPDNVKIDGYICKERDDKPKKAARAGEDHRAWSLRNSRLCITWLPASAAAASQLLTSIKTLADTVMSALDHNFRKMATPQNVRSPRHGQHSPSECATPPQGKVSKHSSQGQTSAP